MMIQSRAATIVAIFSSILIKLSSGVPAIVWSKGGSNDAMYSSKEIMISQLIESLDVSSKADDLSVVFLLARDTISGSESLTTMAPLLSKAQQTTEASAAQHLHVSGIESGTHVVNVVRKALPEKHVAPVLINMNELTWKLNSTQLPPKEEQMIEMDAAGGIMLTKTEVKQSKRIRALDSATFFIVNVPSDIHPDVLDNTIMQTLHHPAVTTVVLSGVRGISEVKYEREGIMRRKLLDQTMVGANQPRRANIDGTHRRLQNEGDDVVSFSSDLAGVYYVQLTPNILAGLLFFFLFATVAMIGLSCMNMISGQDVYVHVMPSIGREA
jgi:hypothetical protein